MENFTKDSIQHAEKMFDRSEIIPIQNLCEIIGSYISFIPPVDGFYSFKNFKRLFCPSGLHLHQRDELRCCICKHGLHFAYFFIDECGEILSDASLRKNVESVGFVCMFCMPDARYEIDFIYCKIMANDMNCEKSDCWNPSKLTGKNSMASSINFALVEKSHSCWKNNRVESYVCYLCGEFKKDEKYILFEVDYDRSIDVAHVETNFIDMVRFEILCDECAPRSIPRHEHNKCFKDSVSDKVTYYLLTDEENKMMMRICDIEYKLCHY